MPTLPVLVIQNDPREGLGLLEGAIERAGRTARVLEAWAGDRIPGTIAGYSHLIVLGGPQAAYNAPHVPYLRDEVRALREAVATSTPTLGICLGAQLMARACGGRAYPGPAPEIGWRPVGVTAEAKEDHVLRELPDRQHVFQWHGDTFDLPPEAIRLAGNEAYANQAFKLRPYAYGLQFHLEWDLPILEAVTEGAEDELAKAGLTREGVLEETRKRLPDVERRAAQVFDAFLDCGCH